MSIKLFYDSETTNLADFKAPSDAPHQPHIVQLAAALVDTDTRKVIERMNVIVRPDGWEIPLEASNVHGITTEMALRKGIGEQQALDMFLDMSKQTSARVGHNITFDERIIRIAMCRYMTKETADEFKAAATLECTMRMATPICKLPPTPRMVRAGRNHFKAPNLTEAFELLTATKMTCAHDAMADVDACIDIYFIIKEMETESCQ